MADCTLKLRGVVATEDVKDPTVGSFEKGDKFSCPKQKEIFLKLHLLTIPFMALII